MHVRRLKIIYQLKFYGLKSYILKGLLENHGSVCFYYGYYLEVVALRTEVRQITIQCDRIPARNIPKYGMLFSLIVCGQFSSRSNAESYKVNETVLGNHNLEINNSSFAKEVLAVPAWQGVSPRVMKQRRVSRKDRGGARGLVSRGSRADISSDDVRHATKTQVSQSPRFKRAQALLGSSKGALMLKHRGQCVVSHTVASYGTC